jgi:hypothetical protein
MRMLALYDNVWRFIKILVLYENVGALLKCWCFIKMWALYENVGAL